MARDGLGSTARTILEELGGVASTRVLADETAERTGYKVSVRDIRDVFRHYGGGVRKLGAGYYAHRDTDAEPVLDWVLANLTADQQLDREKVIERVMGQYPNGSRRAVLSWYHQVIDELQEDAATVTNEPAPHE